MNGFNQHGIERLSPSQVNKAREAFDAWYCEKILGFRFPSGSAAHRGTAAEAGVSEGLFDPSLSLDECVERAIAIFDRMTALENFSEQQRERERESINVMVRDALTELRPLGVPARPPAGMKQHMVELQCRFADGENGTIRYIGYLDFVFPEHNLVVDLKTSSRLPTEFSTSHAIQAAFYKKASGKRVRFLYVSPKKTMPRFTWIEMDDPTPYLKIVKEVTARMEAFLRLSPDKDQLAKAIVPNLDSFYWTNADHIAEAVFAMSRVKKAESAEVQ